MRIDHPLPGDQRALRQLWQASFGDTDAFLDIFFSTAFAPERCVCIQQDGQILAAAYWLDCQIGKEKAAYIYAVATAQEHRGQGYCRRLMDHIHSMLSQRGYCGSLLVPGDGALRRMYHGMGYRNFGGMQEDICTAQSSSAQLQGLDPAEFAALRRQYLPENGVLQEDATLQLLSHVADFYAGKDFMLAISREEPKILELLGNTDAAAGIAYALHLPQVSIRTPGTSPFAMYRPLQGNKIPSYFGFALD